MATATSQLAAIGRSLRAARPFAHLVAVGLQRKGEERSRRHHELLVRNV